MTFQRTKQELPSWKEIHNPAAFGVCHRAACGIWELLQTTQELRKLLLCSTAPLINYISSEYPQHQVSRRNKMP